MRTLSMMTDAELNSIAPKTPLIYVDKCVGKAVTVYFVSRSNNSYTGIMVKVKFNPADRNYADYSASSLYLASEYNSSEGFIAEIAALTEEKQRCDEEIAKLQEKLNYLKKNKLSIYDEQEHKTYLVLQELNLGDAKTIRKIVNIIKGE